MSLHASYSQPSGLGDAQRSAATGSNNNEAAMSIHNMLAEAQIHLRNIKDDHEKAKAFAEQRAISGGATGKNEEERKRSLIIALAADEDYQRVLKSLRGAEAAVAKLEADIETFRDARRDHEWKIRSRLAGAVKAAHIDQDTDLPDEEFDATMDHETLSRLESNLRNGYQFAISEPDEEYFPF